MKNQLLMLMVAALVMFASSTAMAQWYGVPTPVTVYSPVVAPAPVTVYHPAPVTVYRPAPVVTYRPAVVPAPVAVYRPAPVVAYPPVTVYYRPEIRVPGQPVRNVLRAIVP